MSWVLDHSESELASRLVLLAIANHCDASGRNAWPAQETIATEARVSDRTVRRCVDVLVEMGELTVKVHGGKVSGQGRTNYYELPRFIETRGQQDDLSGSEQPDTAPADHADNRSSTPEQPDISESNRTPVSDEPSLRSVHEPSSSSSVSDDSDAFGTEDDDVWIEYAHLKADASPVPIGVFSRWIVPTIEDGKEAVGHKLTPARERWPEASLHQLARYLFDGTEPKHQRLPSCPGCCAEFDSVSDRDEHYAMCWPDDPDFVPADSIPAAGGLTG